MIEYYIIYALTVLVFGGIAYGNTDLNDKAEMAIDGISSLTFGVIITTSLISNM